MFEARLKKVRVCEEQNEILRIRIFVPTSESYPKISGFYEDIAKKAIDFCSEKMSEMAKKDYKESRERGTPFARYFYSLSCDLLFESSRLVIFGLKTELKRGANILEEFSDTQWWELESERMIPPRLAIKEYFEWSKGFGKLKVKTPVLLEGNKMFALFRGNKSYIGDIIEKSQ